MTKEYKPPKFFVFPYLIFSVKNNPNILSISLTS